GIGMDEMRRLDVDHPDVAQTLSIASLVGLAGRRLCGAYEQQDRSHDLMESRADDVLALPSGPEAIDRGRREPAHQGAVAPLLVALEERADARGRPARPVIARLGPGERRIAVREWPECRADPLVESIGVLIAHEREPGGI